MQDPLPFDPKRKTDAVNKRRSVAPEALRSEGAIGMHSKRPRLFEEIYVFTDMNSKLSIQVNRLYVNAPFENELPEEYLHLGDFHGATKQLMITIPTKDPFPLMVKDYVGAYGAAIPFAITEDGLHYHTKDHKRLLRISPKSMYVEEVKNYLEMEHPIADDEFTLDDLTTMELPCEYGIIFDERNDTALEYECSNEDEDVPTEWNLMVHSTTICKEFLSQLIESYSRVRLSEPHMRRLLSQVETLRK